MILTFSIILVRIQEKLHSIQLSVIELNASGKMNSRMCHPLDLRLDIWNILGFATQLGNCLDSGIHVLFNKIQDPKIGTRRINDNQIIPLCCYTP